MVLHGLEKDGTERFLKVVGATSSGEGVTVTISHDRVPVLWLKRHFTLIELLGDEFRFRNTLHVEN